MNALVCLRCPRVQPPPYNGSCVCLEDGVDITRRDSYCPLKKFGDGISPAGWQSIPVDVTKFGKPLEPTPAIPLTPIPRADWPIWSKSLALLATEDDTGIGDVIHRLADKIPAPILAMMKAGKMAWTGEKTCKCEAERVMYSQLYPLR